LDLKSLITIRTHSLE